VNGVACTVLPDGTPVAVMSSDRTVRVWDLATGTKRASLTGPQYRVNGVACTVLPDGTPVAVTGGDDRTVRVWDLATGTERATLTGHEDSVNGVACTVLPDGTTVAVTGGDDRTVRMWDLATGTQRGICAMPLATRLVTISSTGVLVAGSGSELVCFDSPPVG
jgi:WD40 repeat protein